jgi:hypothetical protein
LTHLLLFFLCDSWSYDATTLTLNIHIRVPVATQAGDKVSIIINLVDSPNCEYLSKPQGFPGRLARIQAIKGQLDNLWRTASMVYQDLYPNFMLATETASRINSQPWTAMEELQQFDASMVLACGEMLNLKCSVTCNANLIKQVTAWMNC